MVKRVGGGANGRCFRKYYTRITKPIYTLTVYNKYI